MKKIIKLKESDLVRIVKLIIAEQTALPSTGDTRTVSGQTTPSGLSTNAILDDLEDYMNLTLLKNAQTEVLNNFVISFHQKEDKSVYFKIKSKEGDSEETILDAKMIYPGNYQATGRGNLVMGKYPTSKVIEIIEQNENYAKLFTMYPKYKQQIIDGLVDVVLEFRDSQTGGKAGFTLSVYDSKSKKGQTYFQYQQGAPLGDFFNSNLATWQLDKNVFGSIQSNNINIRLSNFGFQPEMQGGTGAVTGETTTNTGSTQTNVTIDFSLVDAFKFDGDEFVNENDAIAKIDKLAEYIITNTNKYGKELVDHIMKSKPQIIGYASIDGPSNEKITGKYSACKSNTELGTTREQYNQCLSENRAKQIATLLNQKLSGTGITIGYFGAGETTQFGPGWTKEVKTNAKQTAPNRKFVLSSIPVFSKTIGKK